MLDSHLLYFSPIIIATLGAYLLQNVPEKHKRILIVAVLSIFGMIPIFLNHTGFFPLSTNIEFLLLMAILLPLGILMPFVLIEDQITLQPRLYLEVAKEKQPKFPLVFIVALGSCICLFFCGFLCMFGGRAGALECFSLLRPAGLFIDGGIFACAGYGMILILQTLIDLMETGTKNPISRWYLGTLAGSIIIPAMGMLSIYSGRVESISPSNIPFLWILFAGTGIVLFFFVRSLSNQREQFSILLAGTLIFFSGVLFYPGQSGLFILGGGTLMILAAGLGMVSGMIIGAKILHPAIFISDLLISSAILICGLHWLGILDLVFTCPTMDNPVFSNPWLFVFLFLVSAVISAGISWICITVLQKINGMTDCDVAQQ